MFNSRTHNTSHDTTNEHVENPYPTPVVDYTIQNRRDQHTPVAPSPQNSYNTHGMIHQQQQQPQPNPQHNIQRPSSAQNSVNFNYESAVPIE